MTLASAPFGRRDVDAAEKAGLVRGVFDSVAGRYDLMNDLMSAGLHRLWKDAAAARLNPQPGEVIVDCAGGTGDMARRFSRMAAAARRRRGGEAARIVLVDRNLEMLRVGRRRPGADAWLWTLGDAEALPLPDVSADGYCIAFGLRNVTNIALALAEARRILKPGGRFLCLEFSAPVNGSVGRLYDAYSFRILPAMGATVAGDRDAYVYLAESIRRFPARKQLTAMLEHAGFSRVSITNFAGGVCALHQAWAV